MFRYSWAAAIALAAFVCPFSVSAKDIKIGVSVPLSGSGAAWGIAEAEGVRFAAEDVNQAGGLDINGVRYKVDVVVYDDQYKSSETVAAYNRLINQDGAKYIFLMSSAATMALKQTIENDDVLVLTGAYASKAIDPDTRNLVRLMSPPADYIPAVVRWMKANVQGHRVAIINPNDESGWDILRISAEAYTKEGFEVVARELAERSQKEFMPLLTRIIASDPDIIELGGTSPSTAGLIVRQARELGYKKEFSALGGSGPREVVAAAGAQAAEGMINVLLIDPANKDYQSLVERFRNKFGQAPNEFIVPYYDATKVLLKAISLAGDPDNPRSVRDALARALPMTSLQGHQMTFGSKSTIGIDAQIMTGNFIGKLHNGQPVAVGATR